MFVGFHDRPLAVDRSLILELVAAGGYRGRWPTRTIGHQRSFTAADRTSGKGWEQTFEFDRRWLLRSAATGRWTNLPGQTDSSAFPILGGTTEGGANAASNGADVKEYSVSGLDKSPRK